MMLRRLITDSSDLSPPLWDKFVAGDLHHFLGALSTQGTSFNHKVANTVKHPVLPAPTSLSHCPTPPRYKISTQTLVSGSVSGAT